MTNVIYLQFNCLFIQNSQQMLKYFSFVSMHPFKDPMTVADDFADIYDALMKCLFIYNFACINYGFYVSPQIKI